MLLSMLKDIENYIAGKKTEKEQLLKFLKVLESEGMTIETENFKSFGLRKEYKKRIKKPICNT